MAVAACRSNLARLISTHAAPPLLAYTRFAAAGPSSYAQRHRVSPLDALVFARATHASAASAAAQASIASSSKVKSEEILCDRPPAVIPESPNATPSSGSSNAGPTLSSDAASPQVAARPPDPPRAERAKPQLRSRKAALSLTPGAVDRLRSLLNGPHPQLIRIGVRNKGCAGMSYHLEYVDKPAKFDEVVEQDGVRVLIDSKALFSIIGSEMDWVEDRLSAKFAFKNPNVKDACGCGESFTLG